MDGHSPLFLSSTRVRVSREKARERKNEMKKLVVEVMIGGKDWRAEMCGEVLCAQRLLDRVMNYYL